MSEPFKLSPEEVDALSDEELDARLREGLSPEDVVALDAALVPLRAEHRAKMAALDAKHAAQEKELEQSSREVTALRARKIVVERLEHHGIGVRHHKVISAALLSDFQPVALDDGQEFLVRPLVVATAFGPQALADAVDAWALTAEAHPWIGDARGEGPLAGKLRLILGGKASGS